MMYQVLSDKKPKIKSFTDLAAWQQAHKLAIRIYQVTKTFPKEEQFGLTSQIRRAAVSVTSNIAEGFSRASKAEKINFYTIAQGSITELQSQLLLARDIGYLSRATCADVAEQTTVAQKLTHGLLKALRDGKGVRA